MPFALLLLTKTLRSSTLRLALICIGIFGTVVCALFSYVYWSTASYVRSRSDDAIAAERTILRQAYRRDGREGLVTTIAQRIAAERLGGSGLYLLADGSFAPVAGNLMVWPAALQGTEGWGNFDAPEWKPDAADRPLLRAAFETLPDGYHLLVGKDIDDLDEFTEQIGTALTLSVLFTFLLAGFSSIFVTRRTVGRIEAINATSQAIMHRGLGQRIPRQGTGDEWDQLAENLNLMLDRIEGLMGEVKEVSDNVAHDLRTPLARMRGRLEKAYATPRDTAHDQALIGDTLADLDSVLRMFASLTRIAQIEASDRMAAFRTVNLAHIAREVAELFDAAAEERGGHLGVAAGQEVLVTGDRDLLFDAVANLIDNAIKHGREGGAVTVEVSQENGAGVIAIADNGPGIPVGESRQVFKRFYRLERSRRTPGNGLGLSLVAAVARLHGARIELADNAPGLRVRLVFSPVGDDGGAAEAGGSKD